MPSIAEFCASSTNAFGVVPTESLASSPSGFDSDIYLQSYDANGNRLGGEERVNTSTSGSQTVPSMTALRGGGFVVAWQSSASGSNDTDIYAQVYDENAVKVDGELLVNTTQVQPQSEADLTSLPDGGFLIVWSSDHSGFGDIYSQRFDASGERVLEILGASGEDVIVLNIAAIANDVITNVEAVDIMGSGNNMLILDYSDVHDISSTTDTLKIEGNTGDAVQIIGVNGWTNQGISSGYNVYTMDAVTLVVDRDVTVL